MVDTSSVLPWNSSPQKIARGLSPNGYTARLSQVLNQEGGSQSHKLSSVTRDTPPPSQPVFDSDSTHSWWSRARAWYQRWPLIAQMMVSFLGCAVVGAAMALVLHLLPMVPWVWSVYVVTAAMLTLALWSMHFLVMSPAKSQSPEQHAQRRFLWLALCVLSLAMLVLNLVCPLTLPTTAGALFPSMAMATLQMKTAFVSVGTIVYGLCAGLASAGCIYRSQRVNAQEKPIQAQFLKGMAWGLLVIATVVPIVVLCSILGVNPFLKVAFDCLYTALTPAGLYLAAFVGLPLVMGGLCGAIRAACSALHRWVLRTVGSWRFAFGTQRGTLCEVRPFSLECRTKTRKNSVSENQAYPNNTCGRLNWSVDPTMVCG